MKCKCQVFLFQGAALIQRPNEAKVQICHCYIAHINILFSSGNEISLTKLSVKIIFIRRDNSSHKWSVGSVFVSARVRESGPTRLPSQFQKLRSVAPSQGALGAALPPRPEHSTDESPATSWWRVIGAANQHGLSPSCTITLPTELKSRAEQKLVCVSY